MSDCYCDFDPPEFVSTSIHTARKQHKCCECNGRIGAGEKYEVTAGRWDGDFSTFKTCERCFDLRRWVQNNVPCFCWVFGEVVESASTAVAEARHRAPEETRGLHFGFLRRVYAIREHARLN